MKRKTIIYFLCLFLVSISIVIFNTFFDSSVPIIIVPGYINNDYSYVFSFLLVAIPFVTVRLIFSLEVKYRIFYILSMYILFISLSLVTLFYNDILNRLSFSSGYPRYWVYIVATLITGILSYLLIRFTKKLSKKKLQLVFLIVDLLYIPMFYVLYILSFIGDPHS